MRPREVSRLAPWLPLLACLWSATARAGMPPPARPLLELPVARLATDLDTDRKADWISAFQCQGPAAGTYYCLQVTESQTRSTQTLLVKGGPGGIRIASRDVDGDQLQDILVMATGDGRPLGIWINDGYGGFNLADPLLFPARIWHEDPLLFPIPPPPQFSFASADGVETFLLNPHGFAEPLLRPGQSLGVVDLPSTSGAPSYHHSGRAPPPCSQI